MGTYDLVSVNDNYSLKKRGNVKPEYLAVIAEAVDLVFSTPKTGIKPHLSVVVLDSETLMDGDHDNKVSVGVYINGTATVVLAGRPLNDETEEEFIRQLRITVLHELFHYTDDVISGEGLVPPPSTDVEEALIDSLCATLVDLRWYSGN